MKKSFILSGAVVLGFLLAAKPAAASILPQCAESGRCTLCDMLQVVINLGIFLFGIVGALVLLYFFYAGFLLLTSAGESGKVKKGKDMMINAVIGFIIVFGAYTGVNFMVNAVTGGSWNWQSNLKCAQLPEQTGWTGPSANQGSGPGAPTAIGTPGVPSGTPSNTGSPTGGPTATPTVSCTNKAGTGTKCTTIAECPDNCFCTGADCTEKRPVKGYPCTKNEQCLNNWCDTNVQYCVGSAGSQPAGQFCTKLEQCQTGLVCITDETDAAAAQAAKIGNCQNKLDPGVKCAARALPHAVGNAYEVCKGTCNSNGVCQ